MNAKQTAPLLATLVPVIAEAAPPLLICGAIFLTIKWLFFEDEKKQPENAPANAEAKNHRKTAETAFKTAVFRPFPAKMSVAPAVAPLPTVIQPFSVPSVPKFSAPVPTQKITAQIPLPPNKKKFLTRADLANVFHHGARALTRTAAVAALKNLGFGKTAAYEALSPNGRFSDWLQYAPDGIIAWTE